MLKISSVGGSNSSLLQLPTQSDSGATSAAGSQAASDQQLADLLSRHTGDVGGNASVSGFLFNVQT